MLSFEDFDEKETLKEANIKLVRDNQRLVELVETLKKEQNEALEFVTKNEELMQKNASLSSELRESNAKISDLQHRLDISVKASDELKKKLILNTEPNKNSLSDYTVIIEREKEKFQVQLEKLKNEILSKEEILNDYATEKNRMKKNINAILSLSQEYFSSPFKNEEKLISYLSSAKANESLPEIETSEDNSEEQILLLNEKLIRKIKKLKKELKQSKEIQKEIEAENFNSAKRETEMKKEAERQIQKIKEKLTEEKHKLSLNEIKLKNELEILKNENKRNLETISALKGKNRENTTVTINNYKIENDRLSDENKNLRSDVSALKSKLEEVKNEFLAIQGQNETLNKDVKRIGSLLQTNRNKMSKKEEEIAEKQTEKEKLEAENKNLILEVNKLKENIISAELRVNTANINSKQLKNAVEESESEKEKLIKAIGILQENFTKQKEEMRSVYEVRNKMLNIIQKLTKSLKGVEKRNESLIAENKNQKKEIQMIQEKMEKEKVCVTKEEIPITAWFSTDFPRELCIDIKETTNNNSLNTTVKLKKVLEQIAKFYNREICELRKDKQTKEERILAHEKVFDDFLSMLSALLQINLNIDILENDKTSSERVKDVILQLQEEKVGTEEEKDAIKADLSDIVTKLEVQSVAEAKEMIEKLYEFIEKLRRELSIEKAKFAKAKKVANAIGEQSVTKIEELDSKIEQYEDELRERENQLQEEKSKQEKLESVIQQLKEVLEEKKQQGEENEAKQKEEHNNRLSDVQEEHKNEIERLNASLERKTKENKDQKEKIEKLEAEIDNWRQTSHSFNIVKQHTDQQLDSLLEQFDQTESDLKKLNLKEKKELIMQYEKYLSDFKDNNKDIQRSQKVTERALEESNAKLRNVSEKLSLVEKECLEVKNQFQIFVEKTERENAISEMKTKTTILSQEIKYQNMIDECKQNYQTEKKKIIAFTADLFNDFFDARMEIDEFCFKSILKSVADELSKLRKQEESIRSIIGIEEDASICDAVTKLIFAMYQA